MITALALALSLLLADAQPAAAPPSDAPPATTDASGGEPLPPGAPTDSYQLSAWCYGALDEYLTIYDRVKPDLRDIDHMFGTPVVEDEPYQSDMAAARVELKMIGASVTEAEKASPRPISEDGVAAIKQGRAIWSVAEARPRRELARAWMLWALPDRCDSNAKELTQRSILFGRALNYNAAPASTQTNPSPPAPPPADATAPPPAAAEPAAQASPTTDTNVPADATMNAGGAPAAPAPTTTDPAIPPYPTAAPGADQPTTTAPSPQP
ncbi:MAG TPA: hypothetical protein VN814_05730 [Caulobacteraceae bacterium]|nr:hypothetical protein [Caulobacteraceae bacterium]